METHFDWLVYVKLGWRILWNKLNQFKLWPYQTIIKNTNYGPVKGVKRKTIYGTLHYTFEGIPFAKPPIGKLRFRAPEAVEPWDGILDCTKVKPKPIQKNLLFRYAEGSEDCLYLNVYVKKLDGTKKLPVFVWIHGGGFQVGEASRDLYGPDYFMEREIVFISITYRMGAFGFLSFKDPELNVPGNAALKDQIMALEWIKDNVHHFNGDKNNVTVLGQSAGAVSIHILMCCERARGLFHKAILMSGTALCSWAFFPQRNWEYRLARCIGYKGSNKDRDILDFLENVDARKIAKVHSFLLSKEEKKDGLNVPFGPIVELYKTKHSVITKNIVELLGSAWSNEIPLILGGTSKEALVLYENTKQNPYLVNELGDCEGILPNEIKDSCTAAERKEKGLKLKKFYFNNAEPKIEKHMFEYIDLQNFRISWHGIHRTILSRLAYASDLPTYVYRFDYDSPNDNYFRLLWCGRDIRGVIHSSDLVYLFFNIFSKKHHSESTEYKTIQRMIGIFIAFATSSDPNCNEIHPNVWRPINESKDKTYKCLNIGQKLEIIEFPEPKELTLWNSLYTNCSLF